MDNDEYLMVQNQIMLMAGLVTNMPLEEFIADAAKADALGPILDPTLWIKGHDKLASIIDMARALKSFKDVAVKNIVKEKGDG